MQCVRSLDDDRRQAVRRLDVRSHPRQRLGDAVHRTRGQRLVPGELVPTLLAGEDPGEEPHERAGVPAVDGRGQTPERGQTPAFQDELVVG